MKFVKSGVPYRTDRLAFLWADLFRLVQSIGGYRCDTLPVELPVTTHAGMHPAGFNGPAGKDIALTSETVLMSLLA